MAYKEVTSPGEKEKINVNLNAKPRLEVGLELLLGVHGPLKC